MSAVAVHLADPKCDQCRGAGVLVLTDGARAQGRLCGCVPDCERCGGEGRLHLQENGISRVARCRCRILPDRIEIFNQADIPARHATATFEAFDKDIEGAMPGFVATWRWVNAWPDAGDLPTRGLLLHGGVGRGKTHLLVAALRHLVFQHGVRVKFVEFTHLLASLRQGFEEGRGQSSTLQALGDIDLLAIDELGKGRSTDWELTVIDQLVSRRYNGLKPLVATTNFAPAPGTGVRTSNLANESASQSLVDRVGERVYSRIREMCELHETGGGDYRARGG